MKSVLILVDLENEWIDKNSDYFVGNLSEVIKRTNKLIKFCRKNNYKIIFTRHIEKNSDSAFAPNSKNVKLISTLDINKKDTFITKYKISPFYKTSLDKELKGISNIVISGVLTNLCVRSLVEEAYDRELNITVIKDCCATFDKNVHEFTFKDLKSTREEVEFLNLNQFLK